MNILIATGIYPPEIGGPAGFAKALAGALARRGDSVSVVTYGDGRTERGSGFSVSVVPRVGGAFVRYVRYAYVVWREAKNADIVFLQGAVSEGLPGTMGACLAGKPTLLRVPGDYAWEAYQQAPGATELLDEFVKHRHRGAVRILEAVERWTAARAALVVVPSLYLKRVVSLWGVSAERVRVVYSTTPPLPTVRSRDELRRSFGVADKTVLLTAVRAVPWKGGDFLVDLIPHLPSTHALVIAGDGPCLEDWKRRASESGVEDRVIFLGRVSRHDLAEWVEAADVFALATGYEGFPHVVVEAVSAGLPCVVSDKGGNPETKELYPRHVTVVPYRDDEAWGAALQGPFVRHDRLPLTPFVEVAETFHRFFSDVCAS